VMASLITTRAGASRPPCSVRADLGGHRGCACPGLRARAVPSALARDFRGRNGTFVRRADAELGYAARPMRLVNDLGHHDLRRAGQGGRRRRARAAVVHDGGDRGTAPGD